MALLDRAGGLPSAIILLRWWPVFINLLYLPPLYMLAKLVLRDQKKLEEAAAAFRKADQLLPNHSLLLSNLRQTERWIELDRRWAAVLAGKIEQVKERRFVDVQHLHK